MLALASSFGTGYKFLCCLLDAVGPHGNNLLLKLFYPLRNIPVVGLALRFNSSLIIALAARLDLILLLMQRVRTDRAIQVGVLLILAAAGRTGMLGFLFANLLEHLL